SGASTRHYAQSTAASRGRTRSPSSSGLSSPPRSNSVASSGRMSVDSRRSSSPATSRASSIGAHGEGDNRVRQLHAKNPRGHHLREGLGPPGKLSSSNKFCDACKKDIESFGGVVRKSGPTAKSGRTAKWDGKNSNHDWNKKQKEHARSGTPPYPEYEGGKNSR